MARAATKKPAAKPGRKPSKATQVGPTAAKIKKPVGAKAAKSPVAKVTKATKKQAVAKAPMVSKDELRNQVEQFSASLASVRAKNREANKALKAAYARIEELEKQVGKTATPTTSLVAESAKQPAKRGRKSRAEIEAAANVEPEAPKSAKRGRKPRQAKEITVEQLFDEPDVAISRQSDHKSGELEDAGVNETSDQSEE